LEWPSQEEPESGLTASAPVLDVSARACANGYGFLCGLWVWRRRTNRWPCCPPLSTPSTSPWTAWPDGAGRWDNWMAAQHLPRDLVRPSSGFNNSLKEEAGAVGMGCEKQNHVTSDEVFLLSTNHFTVLTWRGTNYSSYIKLFVSCEFHAERNETATLESCSFRADLHADQSAHTV